MQPDLYELNVETGDRLLLCSDGICGMIEDHEIASIMRQAPSAQSCADQLVEAALAAGGFDNATAVVVDVEGFKAVREKKPGTQIEGVGYWSHCLPSCCTCLRRICRILLREQFCLPDRAGWQGCGLPRS